MSCYKPKRKTASGVEEVTFPIASVDGLQDELTDIGNKTIDKVDYFSVQSPENAMQWHNMDATVYVQDDGISFNTMCDISSDVNGSEVTYAFPMSTHIPIIPGENVALTENSEGTAITINAIPKMPTIRVANVFDTDTTMVISQANPLKISVEIIDGKLQVGDELQVCTRQLFTYDMGKKKKRRLRRQWGTMITEQNVNEKYLLAFITDTPKGDETRLFRTGSKSTLGGTLSPVYVRIRRPVYDSNGDEISGTFSNVVTLWKRYDRITGQVFIK